MVEMEKRTYRLTGFTPMLGSSPANSEVRTRYILEKESKMNLKNLNEEQKKAKTKEERERIQKKAEEEASFLREGEDDKITVFMANPKTGTIMLLDYQVKVLSRVLWNRSRRRRASRPRAERLTSTFSFPLAISRFATDSGTLSKAFPNITPGKLPATR